MARRRGTSRHDRCCICLGISGITDIVERLWYDVLRTLAVLGIFFKTPYFAIILIINLAAILCFVSSYTIIIDFVLKKTACKKHVF